MLPPLYHLLTAICHCLCLIKKLVEFKKRMEGGFLLPFHEVRVIRRPEGSEFISFWSLNIRRITLLRAQVFLSVK